MYVCQQQKGLCKETDRSENDGVKIKCEAVLDSCSELTLTWNLKTKEDRGVLTLLDSPPQSADLNSLSPLVLSSVSEG